MERIHTARKPFLHMTAKIHHDTMVPKFHKVVQVEGE